MDTFNSSEFHAKFDELVKELIEPCRDALLESSGTCSREEIIAQLMMENLLDVNEVVTTPEQKTFLVKVADHMGPDWAQALYHAAVFITKVV